LQYIIVTKEQQNSDRVLESMWNKVVKQKSANFVVSTISDDRSNEGQLQRIATNLVDAVAG